MIDRTIVKENSPTSFDVEQNLQTMNGARTMTFDSKTNHIFTMSVERGPARPRHLLRFLATAAFFADCAIALTSSTF